MADCLTAKLEEISKHWSKVAYVGLKPEVVPETGSQPEWLPDVHRLLAAVEAVLQPHQPGRYVILGSLSACHAAHRNFSITPTEAADVAACPDCTATVYVSCAGCFPQVPWDSCAVRAAITRELLGDDGR